MAITEERKEFLNAKPISELIQTGILIQDQMNDLNDDYKWIKWILLKEMVSTNATKLQHPDILCEARLDKTTFNYSKLALVREKLDPADLKKFYIPEHEETSMVPESYDMRVGTGLKKYGGDIQKLLEEATEKGKIREVTLKHKS